MISIRKPESSDVSILKDVIIASFLVPHGHAAPKELIDNCVTENFSEKAILEDINNPKNSYLIIEYKKKIVGFSKIIFDYPNENIIDKNVTKMERIYLLKEYYGLGLGKQLFECNVNLAKKNNQLGMWLHVWFENPRAIDFYEKMGMKKIGYYDFPVAENYTNPNHVMYLTV